jgi:hypothetical protein
MGENSVRGRRRETVDEPSLGEPADGRPSKGGVGRRRRSRARRRGRWHRSPERGAGGLGLHNTGEFPANAASSAVGLSGNGVWANGGADSSDRRLDLEIQ